MYSLVHVTLGYTVGHNLVLLRNETRSTNTIFINITIGPLGKRPIVYV